MSGKKWTAACCFALIVAAATATAQERGVTFDCVDANNPCAPKCGGEVNISGATLFEAFFRAPASTNDYIDADCDGRSTQTGFVDQLAPSWSTPNWNGWWLVQYRGVGSGNGLTEFVRSNLQAGWHNQAEPDIGLINRFQWNVNAGDPNEVSPYPPVDPVQLAVMDVPTTWFVRVSGTPDWTRHPTEPGYGNCPLTAWAAPTQGNKLKTLSHPTDPNTYGSLNLNYTSPDNKTVYDSPIAWVPIAIIGNRGTGFGDWPCCGTSRPGKMKGSEAWYLWLTGRLPSGENLVAATRDSGSGTRNGAMNSLCIDPSWGIGDNLNLKSDENATTTDALGPDFQATNMGGSSRMEAAVLNCRLAVGYTGLVGSSRAIGDALAGNYEIFDIMFDMRGGTEYVRPSLSAVLYTCDPNTGWQIGGNETFASVGDPEDIGYPMADGPAKDYLKNIVDSVGGFVTAPTDPANNGSPGEYLATQFTLAGAISCMPNPITPCTWEANPAFNPTLQAWTLANNNSMSSIPAYGSIGSKRPTRKVSPTRAWPTPVSCDCPYPPTGFYSDGTNGTNYYMIDGTTTVGNFLNTRNIKSGDFNGDNCRDINDIPAMLAAYYDRYVLNVATYGFPFPTYAPLAGAPANQVCVDIIGDFNGDGNFDCRDVRYFADGLALNATTCRLERAAAFLAIDNQWFLLTGDNNFFNTTIYDCSGVAQPWVPGASAADVAGNVVWRGAAPHGYDCSVDCTDALYIDINFGDWTSLSDARGIDLSCDLTNDLAIDCDDALAIRALMGGCVCPNLTHPCQPTVCRGDCNCDGAVGFADIDLFVAAIPNNQANWAAKFQLFYGVQPPAGCWENTNVNGAGTHAGFDDIDPFVKLIPTPCTARACCFPDHTCQDLLPGQCLIAGGTFSKTSANLCAQTTCP